MIRQALLAAAATCALSAPAVHADPVYWSLNVGVPGVITQFSNVYAPPVYVAPPPPPAVVYYPGYAPVVPAYGYRRGWHHDGPWHRRHRDDDDD